MYHVYNCVTVMSEVFLFMRKWLLGN